MVFSLRIAQAVLTLLASVAPTHGTAAGLRLVAATDIGFPVTTAFRRSLALIDLGVVLVADFVGVVFDFASARRQLVIGWVLGHGTISFPKGQVKRLPDTITLLQLKSVCTDRFE